MAPATPLRAAWLCGTLIMLAFAGCTTSPAVQGGGPPEGSASASAPAPAAGSAGSGAPSDMAPEAEASAPEIEGSTPAAPAEASTAGGSAPDPNGTAALPTDVPAGGSAIACGEAPTGMSCVPAGWYVRGLDGDTHGCEQMGQPRDLHPMSAPAARVWLDAFYIDQTEVTFGAYMACVEAGDCDLTRPLYRGFSGEQQPMTGVSWFHARQYCEAQGKRLPTEAEWEAAARGPEGDWYPWGNDEPNCDRAILEDDRGRSCGVPQPSDTPDRGRIADVATRPAGRYGLFDMAGNVEEWVGDWWTRDYAACGADCEGVNPRGPCGAAEDCDGMHFRVVKGGSWYWRGDHATGWHRRRHEPDNDPFHHFGFRCAQTVGAPTAP